MEKNDIKNLNWKGVARIYLNLENRMQGTFLHRYKYKNDHYVVLGNSEIYNKGKLQELTKEQLFIILYNQYLLGLLEIEIEFEFKPLNSELNLIDSNN